MASKRRRHRNRPALGEVRVVLDGYAALAGSASAHTTSANAHNATCAFEGASVQSGTRSDFR